MNNFVFLAKQKFYDGLLFNRVAKDFVIQTGSPNNTTSGGPGYTVVGEVPRPRRLPGGRGRVRQGWHRAGGHRRVAVLHRDRCGERSASPPTTRASAPCREGLDVAQKIRQLVPVER